MPKDAIRTDRGGWALALAVVVSLVWGVCFVLIKASAPGPWPLLHAGLRSVVGGGVLAGWVVIRHLVAARGARRVHDRPRLPPVSTIVVLAASNSFLALGAMYLAAARSEAAISSILGGGQPLALAVAGWLLFAERPSPAASAGLVLAVAGVALISLTSVGPTRPDGVLLSLVAAVAPALGTVAMRRLGPAVDLVAATALQFVLGGAGLLLVSSFIEPRWASGLTGGLVVDVAFQGVVATGMAYLAWFWLLPRLTLVRLGSLLYLVPITGVAVAILAGERPAQIEIAGAGVILAGVALTAVPSRGTPVRPAPVRAG